MNSKQGYVISSGIPSMSTPLETKVNCLIKHHDAVKEALSYVKNNGTIKNNRNINI